jgi:hypothetical protein
METTMNVGERIHNVPVPERFLPLAMKALADAYAAEEARATSGKSSLKTPSVGPHEGSHGLLSYEWSKEDVVRAYREVSSRAKEALAYIAVHSECGENERCEDGKWVTAPEVARAVYPGVDPGKAEHKLFGTLGRMGRRFHDYGKHWFFLYGRESLPDGTPGSMNYHMHAREAEWIKRAAGIE